MDMLKRLMLSVVALLMATWGFSQEIVPTEAQKSKMKKGAETVSMPFALAVGPKLNFNYSFAKDVNNLGIGGNPGFGGGLAANLRMIKRPLTKSVETGLLGVQFEIMYSLRSLKTDTEKIKMNCYEIPLLFQWWFAPDFSVEVGPTFTGVFSTSPEELESGSAKLQTKEIKGRDVMFTFGVEYRNKNGIFASLRYNMGNSNLAGNIQTKVSTLSLSVGFLFSIFK